MKSTNRVMLDKESAKAMNQLAREQLKLKLLADIRIDIEICKIEGWDYKQYLLELKGLIDEFVR